MSKSPRVGLVKTRLASSVGFVEARRIYKRIFERTLRVLVADSRWCVWLAATPDDDFLLYHMYRFFCGYRVNVINQGCGDLGVRMDRIFRSLPLGRIVIIGGDIPDIRARDIFLAFSILSSDDIVIGPSGDGGYWLIGYSGRFSFCNFFPCVRWSSLYALEDTLAVFRDKRIGFVRSLGDVDDADDYRFYVDSSK